MTRRQLETSETWQLIRVWLDERIAGLVATLIDETDDPDVHRCQGAIRELVGLRDEFPGTFPDEVVAGKPTPDPVAEVLNALR